MRVALLGASYWIELAELGGYWWLAVIATRKASGPETLSVNGNRLPQWCWVGIYASIQTHPLALCLQHVHLIASGFHLVWPPTFCQLDQQINLQVARQIMTKVVSAH